MTSEQQALFTRNIELTRDMLGQAHLVTPDATEQTLALITAATVLIERQVGRAAAPATLAGLLAVTFEHWRAAAPGETIQ